MGLSVTGELRPLALKMLQKGDLSVDEFNEVVAFADKSDANGSGVIEREEYLKNREILTMDGSRKIVGELFREGPTGDPFIFNGALIQPSATHYTVQVTADVSGQPIPDGQRGVLNYMSYRIVAGEDAVLYHLVNNQNQEALAVGDRVGIDMDGDGEVNEAKGDRWFDADAGFITQFKMLKGEEADKIFDPATVTPRSTGRNLRPTE